MQEHGVEKERYVDIATAQEAIVLAARLQEERERQVSMTELQRAAAEAGIRPDLLEAALAQLSQRNVQVRPKDSLYWSTTFSAFAITLLGLIFGLAHIRATIMAAYGWTRDLPWLSVACALAIGVATPAGRRSKWLAWVAAGMGIVWLIALGYYAFMSRERFGSLYVSRYALTYLLLGMKEVAALGIGALARRGLERTLRPRPAANPPTPLSSTQV